VGQADLPQSVPTVEGIAPREAVTRLRLYVARSTPNSVRAEHNLSVALEKMQGGSPTELEVIDVFLQPKRAITDGVVVTPTLIGLGLNKRIMLMGDLADEEHLRRVLQDLVGVSP